MRSFVSVPPTRRGWSAGGTGRSPWRSDRALGTCATILGIVALGTNVFWNVVLLSRFSFVAAAWISTLAYAIVLLGGTTIFRRPDWDRAARARVPGFPT